MSWGNPEILKHIEASEASTAALSEFEQACLRIEEAARSKDPSESIQGRLMAAAVPLMREIQHALDRRDFDLATLKAVGVADALGCLVGSLIASMPRGVEATMRGRIEKTIISTMKAGGRA